MRKKLWIIFGALLSIVLLLCVVGFKSFRKVVSVNEGIKLPIEKKIKNVFSSGFQDGEELSIVYYSDFNMKKIEETNKFSYNKNNEIKNAINEFEEAIIFTENIEKLHNSINVEKINTKSNLIYIRRSKEEKILSIIILDMENNTLYYLYSF